MESHAARWAPAVRRGPEFGLAAAFVALLLLCFVPMDSAAQMTAMVTVLCGMWYLMTLSWQDAANPLRVMVLILGAVVSLRYVAWRGLYTLKSSDLLGTTMAVTLYLAEVYSVSIALLGSIVNSSPVTRPALTLAEIPDHADLPTVDVFIPSYNEAQDMLEVTVRAALMMRYPADRMRVYLLDDGGTDQKIGDADPARAAAAQERRASLQALCARLGAHYLTRARNQHAKAGNINSALKATDGDYVVILDADHVPAADFLDRTVPWLALHDDVFLVQTPHFMVNPDPIDRNLLQSFRRIPAENDMFYQTIQKGLDFWASSFFCGSAAMLRRRHLMEVGGLAGDTITEDAETALSLHRKGYRSVYLDRPMVAGLAPETFTAFVIQRMRWAQGMIQILLLKKPFLHPGLKWYQRVGYMSSLMFWLFPFARMIFVLSPLAYLLFGIEIYNASTSQIMAYTLPHIVASYMTSSLLFGRTRWPLISEIYEIMQCAFSFTAIVKVVMNPRQPSFVVTPKGDTLDDEFISPLARPFYVLFALVGVGFVGGLWRFWLYPITRDMTTVVLLWNLLNFLTLLAALGALVERRQRRSSPRMPAQQKGRVAMGGDWIGCDIDDLSAGGARLLLPASTAKPQRGDVIRLSADSPPLGQHVDLPCEVCSAYPLGRFLALGVRFQQNTEEDARQAVALAFGDSARWQFFLDRRMRPVPFMTAFNMIIGLIWKPVGQHLRMLSPFRFGASVAGAKKGTNNG
ncbi:MAG TPA: UDP-forming cellulose synthase catalytic subunit [Magnetospirillum sp.]|nr:UDP-forming cellulose synthase catalytic subunit [Magnetospirillum sp.]